MATSSFTIRIYFGKERKKNNLEKQKNTHYIWTFMALKSCILIDWVDLPASLSDLSPWPCKWGNISHLNHGLGKLLKEKLSILSILLNQLLCHLTLGDKNFIWVQEALGSQQVLEVAVVKLCWADKVQKKQGLVSTRSWAPGSQLCSIFLVKGEVS